jgi:hypothetical protein
MDVMQLFIGIIYQDIIRKYQYKFPQAGFKDGVH